MGCNTVIVLFIIFTLGFILFHGQSIVETTVNNTFRYGDKLVRRSVYGALNNIIITPLSTIRSWIGSSLGFSGDGTTFLQTISSHPSDSIAQFPEPPSSSHQSIPTSNDDPFDTPTHWITTYDNATIRSIIHAQNQSLSDTLYILNAFSSIEANSNQRLHVLKSDLGYLEKDHSLHYLSFLDHYSNYSRAWNQLVITARRCYTIHSEFVSNCQGYIVKSDEESDREYTIRIVTRSYQQMDSGVSDVKQCFQKLEKQYQLSLVNGRLLKEKCGDTRATYSQIIGGLQSGWTWGKITKEYGLSALLFALPGAFDVGETIDDFLGDYLGEYGNVGLTVVGVAIKAARHLYDRIKNDPKRIHTVQKITGTMNMIETMLNLKLKYLSHHIETFDRQQFHLKNLGLSITHIQQTAGSKNGDWTPDTLPFHDFYSRFIHSIKSDLDKLNSAKTTIREHNELIQELVLLKRDLQKYHRIKT